jgi:hypothetical protein
MTARKKQAVREDSLYGEETAEIRAWAKDYIDRNREMLDLMARL